LSAMRSNRQAVGCLASECVAGNRSVRKGDWAVECGWFQPKDHAAPYKALVQRVLARLQKAGLVKSTSAAGG
jgi:hypothetical protein